MKGDSVSEGSGGDRNVRGGRLLSLAVQLLLVLQLLLLGLLVPLGGRIVIGGGIRWQILVVRPQEGRCLPARGEKLLRSYLPMSRITGSTGLRAVGPSS